MARTTTILIALVSSVALASTLGGCETSGQTGALAGAGIGALAGQAIGGNTTGTLIGAAVGAGAGYVVGNEKDKKEARQRAPRRSYEQPARQYQDQGSQLADTRWNIVSVMPRDYFEEYASKIYQFESNGDVVTTTTYRDGTVDVANETYRVVGDSLIINRAGRIINSRYEIADNQLILNAEDFSMVMERLY
jgi:outer membrane protein with glycine zipper